MTVVPNLRHYRIRSLVGRAVCLWRTTVVPMLHSPYACIDAILFVRWNCSLWDAQNQVPLLMSRWHRSYGSWPQQAICLRPMHCIRWLVCVRQRIELFHHFLIPFRWIFIVELLFDCITRGSTFQFNLPFRTQTIRSDFFQARCIDFVKGYT